MTSKAILEKAIRKAIDGGWKMYDWSGYQFVTDNNLQIYGVIDFEQKYRSVSIESLIFNHDFARALWGEREFSFYGQDYDLTNANGVVRAGGGPDEECYDHPVWKWHLQQMIIADDPIKYLGKHI